MSATLATNPDAHLLALETELHAIEARANTYDHEAPGNTWDAFGLILEEYWVVADQIEVLPAHTLEGLQCKARVIRSVYGSLTNDVNPISRHTESLLRDLLGEGAPVVELPALHPDDALLQACAAFRAAWDAEQADLDTRIDDARTDAVFGRLQDVVDLPATTAEGVRAKADVGYHMAFLRWLSPGQEGGGWRKEADCHREAAIDILRGLSGRGGT